MTIATLQDTTRTNSHQFLTFILNDQEFGVEILCVQEIRNFSRVTPIPNMPACIRGVMNLRGTVVPVIDLRSKFDMPPAEYSQFTVIIVLNVGRKVMGIVVDAVSDVLDVSSSDIEGPPDLGANIDTSFITGLAKSNDRLVTLLQIERLLCHEQTAAPAIS